ncbi:hypothetical protein, partial [Escherichia coli]
KYRGKSKVDDKLGVEIHSWLSGHNNVK